MPIRIVGDTNLDFIGKRKLSFMLSAILIAIGIFAAVMVSTGHGHLGIEFVGGTLVEGYFENSVEIGELRSALAASGFSDTEIQKLQGREEANTFLLEPNDTYGHRLVVDLSPVETEPVVTRTPPQTAPGGRPLIIAIDAGHGGDDPGATGPNGVREKQVVLEIARQLAAEVERQPGMRPLLIREGDYFVSHRERMNRAHRAEADLFVSIHADAFRTGAARGATVYMLSSKGASDEAAHRLAERENASDLLGGVSLSDKDDLLAGVLLDLSQSAAISASSIAGSYVIDQLRRVTRVRKSDVQQAPFLVLKSPDIPSLLIETAYISNPEEERALNDSRFRAALARAIHDGIVDYFRANPPPGSYVAYNPPPVRQQPVRHVISRGETLSGIAERYRVRLAALKTYNEISTDVIQVGQVLTIPL